MRGDNEFQQFLMFNGIGLAQAIPGVIYLTYDTHMAKAARSLDPEFNGINTKDNLDERIKSRITVVGEYSGKDALRHAYNELKTHVVNMAPLVKEHLISVFDAVYAANNYNMDLLKGKLILLALTKGKDAPVSMLKLMKVALNANTLDEAHANLRQMVDEETASSIEAFDFIDKNIDGGNDVWNKWLDDSAANNALFTIEEYDRRHNEYGMAVADKLAAEEAEKAAAA